MSADEEDREPREHIEDADQVVHRTPDQTHLDVDGPELSDPAFDPAIHAPPAIEHAAPVGGPEADFTDTLTLAFADAQASIYGAIALERGATGAAGALLFLDGKQVVSHARSDLPADLAQWEDLATDSLLIETGPGAWTIELRGEDVRLAVEFLPVGDPFVFGSDAAPTEEAGISRSERVGRIKGAAVVGGRELQVDARAQRSHQWGPSPWGAADRWRSVAVWVDEGPTLAVWTVVPSGAGEHDREAVAALVADGDPPRAVVVEDPRISTTYDGKGRPLRAGLELWVGGEDPVARRAAGELIVAGEIELGSSRQSWSFLDWHMDGRGGAGALAVVAPAGSGAAG